MRSFARFAAGAREEAREKPGVFALYVVLRLLILAIFVRSLFQGHFDYALLCVLVVVLLYIPDFLEKKLSIEIPSVLEGIILCFVFAAEILGEIEAFYIKVPFWDTMLHALWGFLAAGIGFALVDILNRNEASRLSLTPLYMAISAFCFSMTAGVVWELFEHAMDVVAGFDMQKDTLISAFNSTLLDPTANNVAVPVGDIVGTQIVLADAGVATVDGGYLDVGLYDTMKDLLVNLMGAVAFSVIGFAYVKNRDRRKGSFAAHFIPRLRERS